MVWNEKIKIAEGKSMGHMIRTIIGKTHIIQPMFDTVSPYWNAVWSFFIVLGGLSISLGVFLLYKRKQK